ncbi:MAG: tetratricopeptide repeat protein [Bacteroidota bacterium]
MEKGKPGKYKSGQSKHPKKEVKKKFDLSRWLPAAVVLLLMLLTWSLYKPSLNNHFTNWDDPDYVLENTNVKQLNTQTAVYFFKHASASNYHPLTMLSLSLDYYLTVRDKKLVRDGDEPDAIAFHTTSLLLHVMNVLLVFIFIYLLSGKRIIVATATSMLFAIHPMHVESVAWIAERKDVLYTFFFLLALIVYLKYLEKPGWFKLLLTLLLFLLSLLSKPAAVVFPLILLAIDYFAGRRFTARVLLEKIPFFILSVIFGVITWMVQAHTSVAGLQAFTIFQRCIFAAYGFSMYQYHLLFPVDLSAFYPFPLVNMSLHLTWGFYIPALAAIAILMLVIYSARFTRVISFGYLFFFFSVVLVLQFIPVGSAIMADRYSYLSATGLFFIAGWYLDQLFLSKKQVLHAARWMFASLFILYCLFLGKTSREQTRVWKNSETLWTQVIATYPTAEVAYKNRGNYYGSLNMTDKSIQDFMTFLQLKQNDAQVYSNLGNAYGLRGEFDKALDAYSRSIKLDSVDPKTWLNRGITYARAKQPDRALTDYGKALALKPDFTIVYANRAYTFLEMGRFDESIRDYSNLIQYSPRNDNYFIKRGIAYHQLKRYREALADFLQCVAINPGNSNGLFYLSVTYNDLADFRNAYQYALKAKSSGYQVDPTFLETLKAKGG